MSRRRPSSALPSVAAVTLAAAAMVLAGCTTTEVGGAPEDSVASTTESDVTDGTDEGDESTESTEATDADRNGGDGDDGRDGDDGDGGDGDDGARQQAQGDGHGQNGQQQNGQGQNGQGQNGQGQNGQGQNGQGQNGQGQNSGGGGQKPQAKLPAPWPSNEVSVDPAPAVSQGTGVEQRLRALGFWHDGSPRTVSQAIMAAQKYHGLSRTGSIDQATLDALANQTVRPHGLADAGDIVEVDKARQILFVLEDGKTEWVFNVSTGSAQWYETENQNRPGETLRVEGITRNGFHHFFHSHPQGWRDGDLGELYRPRYFDGGIAVHGYDNVPDYPASSGCVRLTVPAMDFIWENDIMPMGMNVWVHGPNPEAGPRNG